MLLPLAHVIELLCPYSTTNLLNFVKYASSDFLLASYEDSNSMNLFTSKVLNRIPGKYGYLLCTEIFYLSICLFFHSIISTCLREWLSFPYIRYVYTCLPIYLSASAFFCFLPAASHFPLWPICIGRSTSKRRRIFFNFLQRLEKLKFQFFRSARIANSAEGQFAFETLKSNNNNNSNDDDDVGGCCRSEHRMT